MFHKGEIPFVRLLIPLIAGILFGMNWPWQTVPQWFPLLGAITCLLLSIMIALYARISSHYTSWVPGVVAQIIVLLAGTFLTLRSAQKYKADYFDKYPSDALIVTVNNEPVNSAKSLRFEAKVDQTILAGEVRPVTGKLLVTLHGPFSEKSDIRYGCKLLIRSDYHETDPPYNPGEFDYRGYLMSRQIYHQTFLEGNHIKVLSRGNNSDLVAYALRCRQQLVRKFYRYIDDSDAAALASTLILGYRSSLSKDIISAYSKTGTLHVLSVSGMHVGIVFIVLNFIFSPLRNIRGLKYASAFIVISAIWLYALITGFSPSVCRAAAMLSFIVFGKALNKSLNNYNLLAISAFVLLIYNPYYLADIGFQLSYLAVFGLIYFQPKIYHLISVKSKIADHAWKYIALSLAAQLATFPISLFYFHQFPVYFLLSNLLVVLPVALIMYLGLLFLFIPWPPLLLIIGDVLNYLIRMTNQCLFVIERLPFSSINGVWINTVEYMLIYLIIICIFLSKFTKRKTVVYAGLLASIMLSASVALSRINLSRQKELIFYSLRQRSAVAYTTNDRAYLITDVPVSEGAYAYSIMPVLDRRGVSNIIALKPDTIYSDDNQRINVTQNAMQFGNFKVLRWNRRLDGKTFSSRINVDAILLNGNPKVTVGQLRRYVNFSILLIDASNTNYKIKQWRTEAETLRIPHRVLKGSPAYIVWQ